MYQSHEVFLLIWVIVNYLRLAMFEMRKIRYLSIQLKIIDKTCLMKIAPPGLNTLPASASRSRGRVK